MIGTIVPILTTNRGDGCMGEPYGYVYMVRNKVNGKIYFGITVNDFNSRYSSGIEHTHNEHLKNSIATYGIENFEINKEFDVAYNEDDLWDLEDMYICLYNTMDKRYGYNKRRSGKEHKGSGRPSEESRRKNSESQKGEKSAWYGRHHTEEELRKMSEAHRGEKNPMYGKNHSEEHKKILSQKARTYWQNATEEQKQKMIHSTKIVCLNTGQVFNSIIEAGAWCGKKNTTSISQCCNHNGKYRSSGKHPITGEKLQWAYYDDYVNGNYEFKTEEQLTQDMKDRVSKKNKGRNKGKFLREKSPRAKKVICIETKQVFNTVTEAGTWCGKKQISACCNGKQKTCGGYHWQYYDEYLEQNPTEKDLIQVAN